MLCILVYGLILSTVSISNGFADDYPSKPVKIIVPLPAEFA
jgi:hypothetical protein